MADTKTSALTELTSLATDDELPIVDSSTMTTKRVTVATLDARFASAAQGSTADSAVQPGDLATVATTGAYADVSGTPTLGTLAAQDDIAVPGDITATGTASSSTFLRGDGAWAEPAGTGGAVDSVNTQTGVVVLDADDIDDTATTNKFATAGQLAAADTAVQPGDTIPVADGGTGATTATDARTNLGVAIGSDVQAYSSVLAATTASYTTAEASKLAGIEAGADVTDATNVSAAGAPIISSGAGAPGSTPAKVGDVYIDTTGDNAYIAVGTASSADWEISNDGAGSGSTNLSWVASTSTVASSTGTDATLTAVDGVNPGLMSVADKSKLDAIEAGADVTDATNVTAAGAVMDSGDQTVAGVKTFSSAPLVPGPTTEFQAATKGYVDQTALLDSEVSSLSGVKSLTVPDSTTISTFGATLVDDADAAAARATLGVPAATTVATTIVLTQAEYDALTPDTETIYYIVG